MAYEIWNRRYTGSKFKLADWIFSIIDNHCTGRSFCDIFAGTGIIAQHAINKMEKVVINDFLYSNEIIYKAFFLQKPFDHTKINSYKLRFQNIDVSSMKDNYASINYGNKFFSYNDALRIGAIRDDIDSLNDINEKERAILIASLLYSADKAANTVGHYDAYIKGQDIPDTFKFDLISPYETTAEIEIHREDANILAKSLNMDIVYIDPPYNSRQYSRFYHVLENITTWRKPELKGVACKPEPENMSDYCRSTATKTFEDLINSINAKFVVVSYNNTYNSKSSSSKNKITLESIEKILSAKGELTVFEKPYQYFNAGKTKLDNHKEFIFISKIRGK